MIELIRALAALAEPPTPETPHLVEALGLPSVPESAAYSHVFLFQLYPYASVYLGPEGMLGGEARDRVAGFWRALGLTPPTEPDHLSALLGLYANLAEREEGEDDAAQALLWRQARQALLHEHLLSWLVPYLDRFEGVGDPAYEAWAQLLQDALAHEASGFDPPGRLPIHLRDAPGLPDPREDGAGFVPGVLAPVRSGMILLRQDLAQASRERELGLRIGERAYALEAFLAQDPAATLDWLREMAERWVQRHRARREAPGWTGAFWHDRASESARLLGELARHPGVAHWAEPEQERG